MKRRKITRRSILETATRLTDLDEIEFCKRQVERLKEKVARIQARMPTKEESDALRLRFEHLTAGIEDPKTRN